MKNKICVYAICKNEVSFIDKWLTSMSEADYIVVLDTGSTDGTFEALKADSRVTVVEQKVISPWRFDNARNESLKLVPNDANILVCTDLDEQFEPGWADILRKNWNAKKHSRCGFQFVWSHLGSGQPGRIFTYYKIHNKLWKWKYPVHEMLWNIETETTDFTAEETLDLFNEIILQHYPDDSKSRGNYLNLLELREKECPQDYWSVLYLAHEYYYHKQFNNSIKKLNKILTNFDDKIDTIERANCYLFLGDNYVALDKPDIAIVSYKNSIIADSTYREPYIKLAELYINQEQYADAIDTIKQGFKNSIRHYSWLEQDDTWAYKPYDLLCLAYYYSGDKLKSLGCAYKAWQFDPENERLQYNLKQVIDNLNETDY